MVIYEYIKKRIYNNIKQYIYIIITKPPSIASIRKRCDAKRSDYKNSSPVYECVCIIIFRHSENGSKSKVITKHKCRLEERRQLNFFSLYAFMYI